MEAQPVYPASPAHCPEFGTNGQSQVPWGDLRPPALLPSSRPGVTWAHPSWGSVGVCDTDKHSALSHLPQKNMSSWDPGKQLQEKTEALPVRHKEAGKGSGREGLRVLAQGCRGGPPRGPGPANLREGASPRGASLSLQVASRPCLSMLVWSTPLKTK